MCEIVDVESDDDVVLVESDAEITGVTPSVLCVGVVDAGTERLLDLLEKHQVSSILDARVQPQRSVAQLRRGCAARGISFEWRPALSSRGAGAAAGDRAAAVLRLAAAARGKGWPCVLFAGKDWGHCAARQHLAAELAARDVHLYHASEEDQLPLTPAKAAKALPQHPLAKPRKKRGVTEGSPCALASTAPDTVFEALEEAATLFAQQRQKVVVWWFVSVW
ncbi:unnamed protein product [Cladocopium goreaui]|uniref:Delta(5) fatty acid desaturase B n=1 Tax=Cladocopium goreaui TaxID=2562237 RepID=A0A9P1BWN6_9DINO|nr:unnamed protein product [Cladocopium goreaui]